MPLGFDDTGSFGVFGTTTVEAIAAAGVASLLVVAVSITISATGSTVGSGTTSVVVAMTVASAGVELTSVVVFFVAAI